MVHHGGSREGAGRKPNLDSKTAREIVTLSASNILRALSPDSPLKPIEIAELSKHFVLKSLPNIMESDGSFAPKTIVLMRNEKAVNESLSENRIEKVNAS